MIQHPQDEKLSITILKFRGLYKRPKASLVGEFREVEECVVAHFCFYKIFAILLPQM